MIIDSRPFEEFLKGVHAADYHGTDDDMPDAFDHWLTELDVEAMLLMGASYGKKCYSEGYERGKQIHDEIDTD